MRSLLVAAALLPSPAPAALAATTHRLHVSPVTVKPGHSVGLHGSVGTGCPRGDQVTLTSAAFKGATAQQFAGVPAVFTTVGARGRFSVVVTIGKRLGKGRYTVSGRCGGGLFGSARLRVV
jgi:hypothetical protein